MKELWVMPLLSILHYLIIFRPLENNTFRAKMSCINHFIVYFSFSLYTNCYDSDGFFVKRMPNATRKCEVDTCDRIGKKE